MCDRFQRYIEDLSGTKDLRVSSACSKSFVSLAAVFAVELLAAGAHASEATGTLVGDIDCDGHVDTVSYSVTSESVHLEVRLKGESRRSKPITFSIGADSQSSLCAAPVKIALESQDFDPKEDLGSLPGFRRSKVCKGIVLDDEQCDAIHVYWNHDEGSLAWWRH